MTSFNLLRFGKERISGLVELLPLSLAPRFSVDQWKLHNARQYSSRSSNSDDKILTISSINQNLVELKYEVRGIVPKKADKIRRELKVCIFVPLI